MFNVTKDRFVVHQTIRFKTTLGNLCKLDFYGAISETTRSKVNYSLQLSSVSELSILNLALFASEAHCGQLARKKGNPVWNVWKSGRC